MEKREAQRVSLAAVAGLLGLFAFNIANAAPPLRQNWAHLDLSAPSQPMEPSDKASTFRALSRAGNPAAQSPLPNIEEATVHTPPSLEERVRTVQREGLPVARLWQTNTTLLHLGFNQKGKPGLWIVKKTH
jgi:hypothetical protein